MDLIFTLGTRSKRSPPKKIRNYLQGADSETIRRQIAASFSEEEFDVGFAVAGGFFDARGVKLPVAVSAFADEIYQAPKSWTEKAYVKLIHYNRFPKGGHFAAWEQPQILVAELRASFAHGLPIFSMMANHPQALYTIADSPVGLAAWFLEHDVRSYEMIARAFDGQSEGLTRDDVLDNLTLTWLTNTAISSSPIYRENKLPFFVPAGVAIPTAVSAFPDEIFQCPRSWAEQAYPKLIHHNEVDKGGHFAAWEQPKLLTEEVRVSFRSLR